MTLSLAPSRPVMPGLPEVGSRQARGRPHGSGLGDLGPCIEEIDSVRETGNLLHDVHCTSYEKRLPKTSEFIDPPAVAHQAAYLHGLDKKPLEHRRL